MKIVSLLLLVAGAFCIGAALLGGPVVLSGAEAAAVLGGETFEDFECNSDVGGECVDQHTTGQWNGKSKRYI